MELLIEFWGGFILKYTNIDPHITRRCQFDIPSMGLHNWENVNADKCNTFLHDGCPRYFGQFCKIPVNFVIFYTK